MTDTMFTRTALTEAAENAGITPDQARTILEAAGVTVQPEKPLPTEPGSVIIATEVRGVKGKWRMILHTEGDWFGAELIAGSWWHRPEHITAWTPACVVPATAAPVALTEDQVGEEWDQECGRDGVGLTWAALSDRWKHHVTATANAALTQHIAPDEGEPIDLGDVREGDRVRVELRSGDEATLTVVMLAPDSLCSKENAYPVLTIRSVHLLHREGRTNG